VTECDSTARITRCFPGASASRLGEHSRLPLAPKRASGAGSRRTSCATPHAVELAREGVPLNVIQRQLGPANLGTTSIYLQGIDTDAIIATVHARRALMMSATAQLRLGSGRPEQRERCPRSRWTVTSATASRSNASTTKSQSPARPSRPDLVCSERGARGRRAQARLTLSSLRTVPVASATA
jgi:hypothetical protein